VTAQPTLFVYVIVVVPAAIPVTRPLLVTVAMDALADTHGPEVAAVTLPVNCVVAPAQMVLFPVTAGFALTVIVTVTEQPLLFV
jgi:hypothetical protein